jgi:acetylornithine deacetylase/succinyl-diaminopimelate desuccinylase-like protein
MRKQSLKPCFKMNEASYLASLRMLTAMTLFVCLLLSFSCGDDAHEEHIEEIMSHPDIIEAFEHIDESEADILDEWIAITEINAPSGKERERAAYVEKVLAKCRLDEVYYDPAGNLIAVRKGTVGSPVVVIDAHLDTVFGEGSKIKAQIRDGKIYAPGIGDNTRNIEAILATIRALNHANIRTKGNLVFVFTVEEETSLRGAEQFIKRNKGKVDYYVVLDGGYEGFTYGGIGIKWLKYRITGPGGHTRSSSPPYSATVPMSRAINSIYELSLPKDPPAHLNVGMVGGGTVVNAKADEAWFTVDIRSTSNEVIAQLAKEITGIVKEESEREKMSFTSEELLFRRAVQIPGHRESRLVKTAEAVHNGIGLTGPVTTTGSNNSIAALLAGIPAISTGTAPCGNGHSLQEWCEIEPFYRGIKKVLLFEVALAQLVTSDSGSE